MGLFGYLRLKTNKQPTVKVVELLPANCSLLLKTDNYSEFSNSLQNRNLLWQELKFLKGLNRASVLMNYFDSLLVSEEELNQTLDQNPVYCALYNDGFLFAFSLKELSQEKSTEDLLKRLNASLQSEKLFAGMQYGIIGVSDSKDKLAEFFDRSKSSMATDVNFIELSKSVRYPGLTVYFNSKNDFPIQGAYFGVTLKPDKMVLNGIKKQDSVKYAANLNGDGFTSLDFIKNIPLLCNAFDLYAVDAKQNYFKNVQGEWWKAVNDSALFNAEDQFYASMNGMAAKVWLPSGKSSFIVGISDPENIKEILPYMCDSTATDLGIFRLNNSDLDFSSSTFPDQKIGAVKFLLFLEDRIVFCENENDANIFYNAASNSSSILNNERFRNYASKNFDADFHLLSYRSVNACSRELIPFHEWMNTEDLTYLKNVGHFSFLARKEKGMINFRISANYLQENVSDEPNVLWTVNTDSAIKTRSYLFRNHTTKEREIIVQSGNEINLLSATGKVIWKKNINEKVLSDIFSVDVFNNGKLQILFNTKDQLHLIDRNGKYVPPYPIKLPAPATNKLCVHDYEKKNDLRLFIACADKKIYNYTVRGERNEGFKPLQVKAEVKLPIAYCKVGLSDYLITADEDGQIYAFSRKGEGRIDFRNKLTSSATRFEILSANTLANTKLVYYDDQDHLINRISLTDVKEISEIKDLEMNQTFNFYDVDRNTLSDLIIADAHKFGIFELNGSKLPSVLFPEEIMPSELQCFTIGPNTYISVFAKENGLSFVYHLESGIFKKFNSTGVVQVCELFNDGKAYALVVNKNELKCVKL